MQTILANYGSLNSASLVQASAVADPNFTQQNNSYIFTEPYNLCGVYAAGATIAAAQIYDAQLNAINPLQIYPTVPQLAVPSNPNVMTLVDAPIPIPLNEQFQAQLANAAGGAEPDFMLFFLKPVQDPAPYPVMAGTPSNPRTMAVITSTIVLTRGVWSPSVAINFTNPLRGGVYQVNGMYLVCATGICFRLIFPRSPFYMGRKLYPGGLCEAAYGNVPFKRGPWWLGGWGRFNYFEPPQIQVLAGTTAGSTTYTGYMDMTYMGQAGSDAMPG